MQIHDIRDDYDKDALLQDTLEGSPFTQFEKWFKAAVDAKCDKPNAMTLSTVNPHGQPRGRIVLLKEMTSEGFVFFTNYQSNKGQHLDSNPKAALCFYWTELERQVLVEGTLTKISRNESKEYFNSRPYDSQISGAVSPQSTVVESRDELIQAASKLSDSLNGENPDCPENWGGYVLKPTLVEFWQGRTDRMHDRFEYVNNGPKWSIQRLAP